MRDHRSLQRRAWAVGAVLFGAAVLVSARLGAQRLCIGGFCNDGSGIATGPGTCIGCDTSDPRSGAPDPPSPPVETPEARAAREAAERQAAHDRQIGAEEDRMEEIARSGDYDTARQMARRLLASSPPADLVPRLNYYLHYMTFARAFDAFNAGNWAAAEREFKIALVDFPRDSQAHWALGRALEGLGREGEATLEYEAAVTYARANGLDASEARQALARLEARRQGRWLEAESQRRTVALAARSDALRQLLAGVGGGSAAVNQANAYEGWRGPDTNIQPLARAKCAASLVWDTWSNDCAVPVTPASLPDVKAARPLDAGATVEQRERLTALGSTIADFDSQIAEAKRALFRATTPADAMSASLKIKEATRQKADAQVQIVRIRYISVPLEPPQRQR